MRVLLGVGMLLALLHAPSTSWGQEHGQPIDYNHRLHTQELEIECVTCHQSVRTAEQAGPPSLETCLECHESPITENPEELRIQKYAAEVIEIPWVRLTFVPDHVYFSHRRHVAVAGVACATCHGPMEMRTSPPLRPLKKIKMSDCIECHEQSGASRDCNACHR